MSDEKTDPLLYPPIRYNGTGGFFAVVASDGTLYRGFRAVRAKRHGEGDYRVSFNASVDRAAYAVTVSCPDPMHPSDPPGYFASVAPLAGEPQTVRVRIWAPGPRQGATAVDAGFHLVVLVA